MDSTKDYLKRRRSKLKATKREEKKDVGSEDEVQKALADAPPVIDLLAWKAQVFTQEKQDNESFWSTISPAHYAADLRYYNTRPTYPSLPIITSIQRGRCDIPNTDASN